MSPRSIKQTWKKGLALLTTGAVLLQSNCNIGDFTTTSTVTLDGREVVRFLVGSWILTPIQDFVNGRIDAAFDQFLDDDDR